ncbi:MAG: dihydroorotase [Saprospiraceae bacterium]
MGTFVIKNVSLVNRNSIRLCDVAVKNERIYKIGNHLQFNEQIKEISGEGLYLLPGIIDDQVHFREPGYTHKGNVHSESRAAVAGGITTFMEMPNTNPATLTQSLLQEKYDQAAKTAFCNYSFYMGASNDNYDEVMRTNPENVCGVKIFMGSSTGNMLVDNTRALNRFFSELETLVAVHCEDEQTIKSNFATYFEQYGTNLDATFHHHIRSAEACYLSSSKAVSLAEKYGTRLHILHITTGTELNLFSNSIPLREKRITSEVCVHHLHFNASQYTTLGNLIKCNPAIKEDSQRQQLWKGLKEGYLDVIATDHAPHTWDEKHQPYINAPSGLPLIQHSLLMMLSYFDQGIISLERIVELMCHNPAIAFRIKDRGYIDEGFYADMVLVDLNQSTLVSEENVLYHCGWSPLAGSALSGKVVTTWVNGHAVYDEKTTIHGMGKRLEFEKLRL